MRRPSAAVSCRRWPRAQKQRNPDHTKFLADQAAQRKQIDAINRKAAQVMSDIEDLTTVNIDTFEILSFGN